MDRFQRPVQAGIAGELKIEGIITEGVAEFGTITHQGRRSFLRHADRIRYSNVDQRADVLAGRGLDTEGLGVGRKEAFGDQILEDGGVITAEAGDRGVG